MREITILIASLEGHLTRTSPTSQQFAPVPSVSRIPCLPYGQCNWQQFSSDSGLRGQDDIHLSLCLVSLIKFYSRVFTLP